MDDNKENIEAEVLESNENDKKNMKIISVSWIKLLEKLWYWLFIYKKLW